MSLLWRQRFLLPDGEGYAKDYRLMMRNPDTRLPYLCDRCPCDGGWSIVALCACGNCGPEDPFFIGSTVEVDSDTVTAEYDGETYDLVLLNIENQATPDTAMSDDGTWGQREAWPVCHGIEGGTRLWGVRHFSREAPEHSGYYNVQVILDGTVAVEWDGTPYVPGEGAWVGDQVPTANKDVNAIMVDHLFDEEGEHTVDLKVSFFGDNDEPTVAYTLRVAVFIVKNSNVDPLEPGQAIIVPHKLASEGGCIVRGEVSGYPVRLYFHAVLKGPFDTYDDANFVYTTWKTLIDHYAASCACERHNCDVGHVLGFNYWSYNPVAINGNYYWMYEGYGGVGDPHTGAGCYHGYIEYEVTKKGSYVVLMRHYDGGYTGETVPTSGILRPCEGFSAFSTEEPDPDDPDFDDKWGFAGDHWIAGTPDEECKFCYGPKSDWVSDPRKSECVYLLNTGPGTPAAYFSDWGYTMTDAENGDGDPHGIPENSEHLRDYTESFVV